MTWRESICTALAGDAALGALIGDRVFPEVAPDDAATPYLVYAEVSRETTLSHDGDDGLDFIQIQVVAWAPSVAVAEKVRDAVRRCLSGAVLAGDIIGPLLPQSPRPLRDDRYHGALIEFSFAVAP